MSRQRTPWLFGLMGLVAAGAAGCVESDAPAFVVGWDVEYVESAGPPVSCAAAGTPIVELTMTNLATHETFVDRFNCESHGGQSRDLRAGPYTVKIALKNDKEVELSNLVGDWNLVRDTLTDLKVVVFPVQSFHLSWTLARGMQSLRCQDVDAAWVNIIARRNSEEEMSFRLPCRDGSGSSPAIPVPGSYSVRLQLLSTAGGILWDGSPMTIPVDGDKRAVLPPIVFEL